MEMLTNELTCLKKVEIELKMNASQAGQQRKAHLKWWIQLMC